MPIPPIALEVIGYNDELSKDALVFPMPASISNIGYSNYYLQKWTLKAGVEKNVTRHVGRHTYATHLVESGVDIYLIR